jgi:hypothetical protein
VGAVASEPVSRILDCTLDVAVAQFPTFWQQHEILNRLELEQLVTPQWPAFAIIETLSDGDASHRHDRARVWFEQRGWDDPGCVIFVKDHGWSGYSHFWRTLMGISQEKINSITEEFAAWLEREEDITPPGSTPVQSKLIPGTIDHFRANMERYARRSVGCWTSSSGDSLRFEEWRPAETLSTKSTWYVWIPSPLEEVLRTRDKDGLDEIEQMHEGDGCIDATEHPTKKYTVVDFYNGRSLTSPFYRPINQQLFEEFCEAVVEALVEMPSPSEEKVSQLTHNIAAIRKLLLAAFTFQALRRFCQDRPSFRPICDALGPNHGLDDMVDEVIDYCEKQLLFDELLVEIKEVNSKQYALFESSLYEAKP